MPVSLLYLSAADLERVLPMRDAVETQKAALASVCAGGIDMPKRQHLDVPAVGGTTLVMPAYLPGVGLGAKLVSVFPRNAAQGRAVSSAILALLDEQTGEPRALLDGTYLTALRTGAASGAATDLLAPAAVRTAAVFGAGPQGRTQALAIDSVRELETIRFWSRDAARATSLARSVDSEARARCVAVADPVQALAGAQVVCTATPAARPLFSGDLLEPGTHVNAVGSFRPSMKELDALAVGRARVFVDSVEAALEESGELLDAEQEGVTSRADWTPLGALVLGRSDADRGGKELTLFKSAGLAAQDLHAGAEAVKRALEAGIGTPLE